MSRTPSAGFTLLEIVMVIALLGILGTIAVSRMDGALFTSADMTVLERERLLMLARIAHVRTEAIRADEEKSLTITAEGFRYGEDTAPMTGEAQSAAFESVKAEPVTLRFDRYGMCASGSAARVTLRQADQWVDIQIEAGGYAY